MRTYDQRTIDAAGVFLLSELERLDKALHMPLVSVTWGRDIKLRSDVTIADETSSFTNSSFAAAGSPNPAGKNFIAAESTEIPGIALGIKKTPSPLFLWGMQLGYSIPELAAAEQTGRPVDRQKHEGLKLKHNMDVDEMVYVGDAALGKTGLINNPDIAPASVATSWDDPGITPKDMLDDINDLIERAWAQSAHAVCPADILLPPAKFAKLTQPVTAAGSKSVLQYVKEECLAHAINGREPNIYPLKWLKGRGAGGSDRAVAYTNNELYARFPLVPLQRAPLEQRGLFQLTTYFGKLGVVEFVYPETVAYADGI
jgi:hypothetical protein